MARNTSYHRSEGTDGGLSLMKSIISPYGIRFQEDGKMGVFPAIDAHIRGKQTSETLYGVFLIDSGATVSVLPASDAEMLGIQLTKGAKTIIRGLGATDFFGYRHMITCMLGVYTISLPVVFIDHPATLRILGREGLFDKFLILFDEKKRRTIFLSPNQRKHIDGLVQ